MRILVVEDEARIAADIAEAINSSGFIAEIAADGEEAWFRGTLTNGIFAGRVEIVGHPAGKFAGLRQSYNETTDRARERQER